MGKIKKLELSVAESEALEKGYRSGEKHTFRQRCQMILLKSEKRSSVEVVKILRSCEMTVNN